MFASKSESCSHSQHLAVTSSNSHVVGERPSELIRSINKAEGTERGGPSGRCSCVAVQYTEFLSGLLLTHCRVDCHPSLLSHCIFPAWFCCFDRMTDKTSGKFKCTVRIIPQGKNTRNTHARSISYRNISVLNKQVYS